MNMQIGLIEHSIDNLIKINCNFTKHWKKKTICMFASGSYNHDTYCILSSYFRFLKGPWHLEIKEKIRLEQAKITKQTLGRKRWRQQRRGIKIQAEPLANLPQYIICAVYYQPPPWCINFTGYRVYVQGKIYINEEKAHDHITISFVTNGTQLEPLSNRM